MAVGNTTIQDRLFVASCFHLPDPLFDKVSERSTMNLVTAIINIISSPLAVIFNSVISIAIVTNSRLRTPSNLLIGCLALSDVLVGLAVQPAYICFRLMENQHRSVPCFVRVVYSNAFYICCGVSFMTLSVVFFARTVTLGRARLFPVQSVSSVISQIKRSVRLMIRGYILVLIETLNRVC